MPSRLVKPRRLPTTQTPEFAIHQDYTFEKALPATPAPIPTHPPGAEHLNGAYPGRTLAPTSFSVANSMKSYGAAPPAAAQAHHYSNSFSHSISSSSGKLSPGSPYFVSSPSLAATTPESGTPRMLPNTIRTVPSFDGILSDTSSDAPSIATKNSALSSSLTSYNSSAASMGSSSHSHHSDNMDTVKIKDGGSWAGTKSQSSSTTPQPASSASAQAAASPSNDNGGAESQQPWDSTIGKAGLGKTGRVINKLVSENEALKRDLQIERLRAEEAKQAAKLTQDKMERVEQDYESRLLDASVTKTLLARKERQVETLTQAVELERKKAQAALEREQGWKAEMERAARENNQKVEEATALALLMDGRYNAIADHWKNQGEEVKRTVTKLRTEVAAVNEERQRDDEKIMTLQDLCDQQDGNIKELQRQKDVIGAQFEAYKAEQEAALKDIKDSARQREEEQARLLEETKQTLDKLNWALNVHKNVPGSQ